MKRSNRLILLIGFLLAAAAFVGIVMLLGSGGGGGTPPVATTTTIVVATKEIPLGTTITADLVATQEVKIGDKPPGSYTLTSEVINHVVTTKLLPGEGIDASAFSTSTVNPDIARLLGPGRRAMSIQVDQVSGVGRLVKPGDRVDVVVGFTGSDKFPVVTTDPQTNQVTLMAGVNATSVKAIIQNLEVVGTLLPVANAAAAAPAAGAPATDGQAPTFSDQGQIVILSVSAQEAEVLRFGQMDGTLTLILRSPGDKEAANDETTGITLRKLVDGWAVIPPQIVETIVPKPKP